MNIRTSSLALFLLVSAISCAAESAISTTQDPSAEVLVVSRAEWSEQLKSVSEMSAPKAAGELAVIGGALIKNNQFGTKPYLKGVLLFRYASEWAASIDSIAEQCKTSNIEALSLMLVKEITTKVGVIAVNTSRDNLKAAAKELKVSSDQVRPKHQNETEMRSQLVVSRNDWLPHLQNAANDPSSPFLSGGLEIESFSLNAKAIKDSVASQDRNRPESEVIENAKMSLKANLLYWYASEIDHSMSNHPPIKKFNSELRLRNVSERQELKRILGVEAIRKSWDNLNATAHVLGLPRAILDME